MRSTFVRMLCWGGILAGLTAGCAGGPEPAPPAAIAGADAAGMSGCGPRPVPEILTPPAFEDARDAADLVFVGRMMGTHDPIPLSVKVPAEDLVLDYAFEVFRIWDGEPADTLWVRSYREPASGGITFSKGSTYLVYARREDGQLWANRCSRTAMASAAYADVYRLGEPDFDSGKGSLPGMNREDLAREVRSPVRPQRIQALRVLEQIAADNPDVVPVMIEAMNAHGGLARIDFIAALGRLGAAGETAVPALVALLDDEESAIRSMAAASLGKIGMVRPEVLPALVDALADEDPAVRASAAQAIGSLGPAAAEAAPALRELLADPQPKVRDTASRSLQLIAAGPR